LKVKKLSSRAFEVNSESGKTYFIWYDPFKGSWGCSCLGYASHLKECKHIAVVKKAVLEGEVSLG